MRKYQRGVTALGWLILLIPVAICVYAGIRVAPVYLNYMNVVHSLDMVASRVQTMPRPPRRLSAPRLASTSMSSTSTTRTSRISKSPATTATWKIEANYDDQAPLFANVSILVTFDKTVKLKGGGD